MKYNSKSFMIGGLAALAFFPLTPVLRAAPDADNSANNEKMHDITPLDQSNAEADLKVTQDIRKDVVKIKDISVDGTNIKIITTKNHEVYLRGPVSSDDELNSILAVAKKRSEGYMLKNQLKVVKK